jgi:hypothetical protein
MMRKVCPDKGIIPTLERKAPRMNKHGIIGMNRYGREHQAHSRPEGIHDTKVGKKRFGKFFAYF